MFANLAEKVAPSHTALLVVDVQNNMCHEESPGTKNRTNLDTVQASAHRIKAFIDDARSAGVRVIFVRNVPHERTAAQAELAARNGGNPARNAPAWDWNYDFYVVEPREGEIIFDKYRYSAFIGTNFKEVLDGLGVETVLMTGVSTNVCVESTARDAYMLDFHVVMVSDCCGAFIPELHEATLRNMNYKFGEVVSADQVKAAWEPVAALAGSVR